MTVRDSFSAQSREEERFIELLSAKWIAQALSAAAELGVYDALDGEPLPPRVLAEKLKCQADPLHRLLRVLAGEGLVEELLSGEFALTSLGKKFRTKEQGTLARFVGTKSQWQPWAHLCEAIRSGQNAFELANGVPLFEFLKASPKEAELYHSAVDAFTKAQAAALGQMELFADIFSVVDVGGGRGTLLVELLSAYSHLEGVLFDLPEVIASTQDHLISHPCADRLKFESGSFFSKLPEGHDCYIIKHVLHNWSDDNALLLLSNAQTVLPHDGTIIVVDDLLIPGNRRELSRFMDLEMFVVTGQGRERSKPEFRRLFSRAGLFLHQTHRLTQSTWAFVLRKKTSR